MKTTKLWTPTTKNTPAELLSGLLSFISATSQGSHWYRLWDCQDDYPPNEARGLLGDDTCTNIDRLNQLSLRSLDCVDRNLWIWLLKRCDIVKETKAGVIQLTNLENLKNFLLVHNIEAEAEKAAPLKSKVRVYIQIGNGSRYNKSVIRQLKNQNQSSRLPRCPDIGNIGKQLNTTLEYLYQQEHNTADEANKDDNANSNKGKSNSTTDDSNEYSDQKYRPTERPPAVSPFNRGAEPVQFPLLRMFGIDDLNLSKEEDNTKFKRLMGEMVAMQQQHNEKKSTVEFIQPQQSTQVKAVMIRQHKNEKAFKRYHYDKPYLDDVVSALDNDKKVGARRLADHLVQNHQDEFVAAANESGVAVCGVLNAVEGASMMTEALMVDAQWNTVMRHLRCKFPGSKITVPLQQIKAKMHEDYTEPVVDTFKYSPDGKEEEKITSEYQDIKIEFKKVVTKLLRANKIKDHSRVKNIRLVVGGDHGQGAFRLGFKVIMYVDGIKKALTDIVSIATVTCKKEVGAILESTVIKYLSDDLKYIHENQVHLFSFEGGISLAYEAEMEPDDINNSTRIVVQQLIAGDLAWECFCLGKEGASNHWCIYCKYSPSEWTKAFHDEGEGVCPPAGERWTIDGLNSMADDSTKKDAKRLGVKKRTFFPWIPVENYILPVLHLKIGLINDVIDYFGKIVEWRLIKVPREEREWMDRVDILNEVIPVKQKAVIDWNDSGVGKRRRQLANKKNRTAEEEVELNGKEGLNKQFQTMGSERDRLKEERTTLNKKIAKAQEGRRKPKEGEKTWYTEMEDIYRENKIQREDYHKRKFTGRPLKDIMDKAEKIFTKAKDMLRRYKRDGIADIDGKIDSSCDEVIDLLINWSKVFRTLYTENPSTEKIAKLKIDAVNAGKKHRALRKQVDDNFDTPKLHLCMVHAAEALERFPDLVLMIEEWIERLHQTERSHIESKTKHIHNDQQRAVANAKKRAPMNNAEIYVQTESTKRRRGPYEKRSENNNS